MRYCLEAARMRQQALLGIVLTVAFVLWSAVAALAKEGIVARLDAPLPSNVPAGAVATVGWTITVPGGGSLIGTATVLRVYSRDGHSSVDAPAQEDRPGHFVATFRVPTAGIATVGIGIPGQSCDPSGCQPAVAWFTIEDPSGAPLDSGPSAGPPDTSTEPGMGKASPSGPTLLLAALSVAVAALGVARRMPRT
jgi:hypothetical protein